MAEAFVPVFTEESRNALAELHDRIADRLDSGAVDSSEVLSSIRELCYRVEDLAKSEGFATPVRLTEREAVTCVSVRDPDNFDYRSILISMPGPSGRQAFAAKDAFQRLLVVLKSWVRVADAERPDTPPKTNEPGEPDSATDPMEPDGSNEQSDDNSDRLAEICDDGRLSKYQEAQLAFLWAQERPVSYESLGEVTGAWRDADRLNPPDDNTVTQALKRLRKKLFAKYEKYGVDLEIHESRRRVKLVRESPTN